MNNKELFIDRYELPLPLSDEETIKLLKETNNGSKLAREKLILHNLLLVRFEILHKFKTVNLDRNDLISIGIVGLIKAIDSYDTSKCVKLSTYIVKCVDNEIINYLNSFNKNIVSLDTTIFADDEGNKLKFKDFLYADVDLVKEYERKEINMLIRKIIEQFSERDREIIKMRYGFYDDIIFTQQEIADKFGVSKTFISVKIKLILEKLKLILKRYNAVNCYIIQEDDEYNNVKNNGNISNRYYNRIKTLASQNSSDSKKF